MTQPPPPSAPTSPPLAGPRRYVAPDSVPSQPVSRSVVTSELTASGCTDSWVTSAVKAETGVVPRDGVCDVALYHGGEWDSYSTLALAVHAVMSTCTDKWVTQAFIDVTGRIPSSADCNIYRYNNGVWDGNYERLRAYVAMAQGRSGDELFSPGVSPAAARHYALLDAGHTPELRQFKQCWLILTGDDCTAYPVVHRPKLHVIYWGKEWNEGAGGSLRQYINAGVDFMMQRSHYLDGLSQYGVGKGYGWDSRMDATSDPQLLHDLVDPAGLLQVQGEIDYQQNRSQPYPVPKDWSSTDSTQPIVVVLVPADALAWDPIGANWSGYHWIKNAANPCSSCNGYVPYVVVKVPQRAFWIDRDAIAAVMNDISHEVVEAATNPTPLYGWADWGAATPSLPFYDAAEPADLCQAVPISQGYPVESTYVVVTDPNTTDPNTYTYRLARYWSNGDHGCYPFSSGTLAYAPGETTRHLL
jgi:hypothetical protein